MHRVSRRRFCTCAAFGGLYLGVVGCAPDKRRSGQPGRDFSFEVPSQAFASVEYGLTMASFRAQLGTTFSLRVPAGGSLDLKLVAVNDLGPASKPLGAGSESFNCLFSPASAASLPQDTYQMNHAVLGTFSIFIVPLIGVDQATGAALPPQYVASFNRV